MSSWYHQTKNLQNRVQRIPCGLETLWLTKSMWTWIKRGWESWIHRMALSMMLNLQKNHNLYRRQAKESTRLWKVCNKWDRKHKTKSLMRCSKKTTLCHLAFTSLRIIRVIETSWAWQQLKIKAKRKLNNSRKYNGKFKALSEEEISLILSIWWTKAITLAEQQIHSSNPLNWICRLRLCLKAMSCRNRLNVKKLERRVQHVSEAKRRSTVIWTKR